MRNGWFEIGNKHETPPLAQDVLVCTQELARQGVFAVAWWDGQRWRPGRGVLGQYLELFEQPEYWQPLRLPEDPEGPNL